VLNQTERNAAILLHANTIENAVLDCIENSDFRTYGLLEDLVSDATCHLLATALAKFKGPRYGLAKFIKTTVRFRTINTLTRHAHTRADMYESFEDVAGDAPVASAAIERQLESARLKAALETLTGDSVQAISLLCQGNQRDAAKAMKVSAPTMTRYRLRAVSELSAALA
jgi:RNA polymerase sigma factor (sigma-70 family)